MKLEVIADADWAQAIGAAWRDRLRVEPHMRVCLPTGETPRPLYARVAEAGVDLGSTEIYLLDEFGLPDGHPARCDSMLRRDLLRLLDHEPAAFHTIDVTASDPAAVAEAYGREAIDRPFDLAMLGLGSNGHLGLNEPGSEPHEPTRVVSLHPGTRARLDDYSEGAETDWGITLGTAALLASREIWLLVRGSHKAEILRKALYDPIGPDVPASYLRSHPAASVFADESAGARL